MKRFYYQIKPFIPRWFQIYMRRKYVCCKRRLSSDIWPIYEEAGHQPDGWRGWPQQKQMALILTHDVETKKGQKNCYPLMELEKSLGFRSAFYFVPKRYEVSAELRRYLVDNGFEVGVHGLDHDGKLYRSKKEFEKRAAQINKHLKEWDSRGFSSPCMHHNLEWVQELNIDYDISTYDTDPFEPQGGGIGTIFPFRVQNGSQKNKYIEFPYTLPQDFTLFVLMKEKRIDIWKKKINWIFEHGGMAHLKTHPDYMTFNNKTKLEEYPADYYAEFLEYIKNTYSGRYWHVLPKDMAQLCLAGLRNDEKNAMSNLSNILCPCCRNLIERGSISFLTPAGS